MNRRFDSRPRKSASGSCSVNDVPLPVGHHSGGCESGVKQMIRRFGFTLCASSRRARSSGARNTEPTAVPQDLAAREEVVALEHAQFLTRSKVLADDTTALSRSFIVPPDVSVW